MFKAQERISPKPILNDLCKLKRMMKRYDTVKWGFLIVVYDRDEMLPVNDRDLREKGYKKISLVPINLYRQEDNERKRWGYDKWREQFDRFIERHF